MGISTELGDKRLLDCSPVVGYTHCNGRCHLASPEGLEITEVMRLASYSKYDTTLKYYPAAKDDLLTGPGGLWGTGSVEKCWRKKFELCRQTS